MSTPSSRVPGPAARRYREGWVLLAACLLGAAWLTLSGATAPLDRVVYDLLLNHRPPPPTDRILIVALDQRSLARTGAWPWPRATQAALVRQIAAARPRAIGIDVLLTEPRDAAGDAALAEAIRAAGNVALPVAFTIPGHNGRAVEIERPLPAFRAASARLGHVNLAPDSDGVMRSAWLGFAAEGRTWPALPLAMLGHPAPRAAAAGGVVRTRPVLIDYPGPTGTIPSVPADSVLRGEVPPELIAGKYVLVGMTANGLGDMHATPFAGDSPLMPGVEIQGSLLATLLAGQPLTPAPVAARLAFTLGPLLLLFALLARLPSQRGPLAALALAGAVAAASSLLMIAADLWMPPAAALLSLSAAYALWAWRRLAVASRLVSAELERVTAEAGAFAHPAAATGGVLDRQLALLADVTARERELRQEHDAVIRLLSHDMRTPQGAILALLDSAAECPPDLAARLRSYAQRTLELADGFVSLSRAQLVELAQDLVSLGDVALDAADLVWPRAQALGMAIDVSGPPGSDSGGGDSEEAVGEDDEVLVRGDRALLTRLVVNLLDNAVKYGDRGQPLTLRYHASTGTAHLTVSNRGPGIPPDQITRIFEAFGRAPGIGRETDGVGLGLAFVHTVAARHGGTVTCRSSDGETRFSVTLPLAHP